MVVAAVVAVVGVVLVLVLLTLLVLRTVLVLAIVLIRSSSAFCVAGGSVDLLGNCNTSFDEDGTISGMRNDVSAVKGKECVNVVIVVMFSASAIIRSPVAAVASVGVGSEEETIAPSVVASGSRGVMLGRCGASFTFFHVVPSKLVPINSAKL